MSTIDTVDLIQLADHIKAWGKALGFQHVGICDIDLTQHESALQAWLDKGYHGDMHYMQDRGMLRARPAELVPGTVRIISVRMDYLPPDASFAQHLADPAIGYVSRYAVGRDYHKVMRKRLKKLGEKIQQAFSHTQFRPFVDSAPVLEHAVAQKAGTGWTGKHSLTLTKEGSWFFLGELFVNLPLPVDVPIEEACGECTACMTICPTNAIVAPYTVDARKCISYLTIEHQGVIPEMYRTAIGNRIYGCDDCQLVCPWNRHAEVTQESDFFARQTLLGKPLLELFGWDEKTFLSHTEGSAIRRIGHKKWRQNIAIALGNAPYNDAIINALRSVFESLAKDEDDALREHIQWALKQQQLSKQGTSAMRQTQRLTRIIRKGLPRDA